MMVCHLSVIVSAISKPKSRNKFEQKQEIIFNLFLYLKNLILIKMYEDAAIEVCVDQTNTKSTVDRERSSSLAQRLRIAADRVVKNDTNLETDFFKELRYLLVKPILIWLIWIIVGTVYYSIRDNFGVLKGFYYASK